jgi:hypothetical protein
MRSRGEGEGGGGMTVGGEVQVQARGGKARTTAGVGAEGEEGEEGGGVVGGRAAEDRRTIHFRDGVRTPSLTEGAGPGGPGGQEGRGGTGAVRGEAAGTKGSIISSSRRIRTTGGTQRSKYHRSRRQPTRCSA